VARPFAGGWERNNPSLLRTVSDDGRLFYQGATVGVDIMWSERGGRFIGH
jgi:hypothetical protein